jgi:hypothetical protein
MLAQAENLASNGLCILVRCLQVGEVRAGMCILS